jgi:hypothetical protein
VVSIPITSPYYRTDNTSSSPFITLTTRRHLTFECLNYLSTLFRGICQFNTLSYVPLPLRLYISVESTYKPTDMMKEMLLMAQCVLFLRLILICVGALSWCRNHYPCYLSRRFVRTASRKLLQNVHVEMTSKTLFRRYKHKMHQAVDVKEFRELFDCPSYMSLK